MIETTGLLGSTIYVIQEAWTKQKELQHANYALRTLPKGLRFFCMVSPSESPKVMGLMGMHHPNALWCFNGVTHCPGVEKRGKMRAPLSTTQGWCITSWDSYARDASAACPSC